MQTYQLVEELRKNKDGRVMEALRELGVSDDQVYNTRRRSYHGPMIRVSASSLVAILGLCWAYPWPHGVSDGCVGLEICGRSCCGYMWKLTSKRFLGAVVCRMPCVFKVFVKHLKKAAFCCGRAALQLQEYADAISFFETAKVRIKTPVF